MCLPTHRWRIVACFGALVITLLLAAPASAQQCSYPIYGVWELTFSAAYLTHEATLTMNGCSGLMEVAFYNQRTRRREQVTQTMRVTSTARGLRVTGSRPMRKGTSNPHPTYRADNLTWEMNSYGRTKITNCDSADQCSPVAIVSERHPVTVNLRTVNCANTVYVAVIYRDMDDKWVRRGWWAVKPSQAMNTDVTTLNAYVFFYAEREGGGNPWRGLASDTTARNRFVQTEAFHVEYEAGLTGTNRRTARFFRRRIDLTKGTWEQRFRCN